MAKTSYPVRTVDEHLHNDGQTKRILALDGGGLRGIVTVAMLEKIESLLRSRHGDDKDFRLCHYFDLIAGTSTGAIIAAALAKGWSVKRVRETYLTIGKTVFEKSPLRMGLVRAKYSDRKLTKELKAAYGAKTALGSSDIETGLLVMTKRIDTGSPWPISNNPRGRYFNDRPGGVIGNKSYPLWQVVRASTAAPVFFEPQTMRITKGSKAKNYQSVDGEFIDGGVSPFNNPALQAVMYATLDGYQIGWPTGADRLSVVSLGTGTPDPGVTSSMVVAKQGINALLSLMEDSSTLQETILQWLSSSPTARSIDRELGSLQHDLLGGTPLISYLRYDLDLSSDSIMALNPDVSPKQMKSFSSIDTPENMDALYELGKRVAERDIESEHFARHFDL